MHFNIIFDTITAVMYVSLKLGDCSFSFTRSSKLCRMLRFSTSFLSPLTSRSRSFSMYKPLVHRASSFFTRDSLCFVSRSTLRGKPIPRLISLTERAWNLDARKFFSVISETPQSRHLFPSTSEEKKSGRRNFISHRERERNNILIKKTATPYIVQKLTFLISLS